jgi:hypothetical protein
VSQPSGLQARTGVLGGLAVAQLQAWRTYAAKWCYRLELRHTEPTHRIPVIDQYHLVCVVCEQSLMTMMSEGIPYMLNTELLLDAITAHLRNVHRDMEATVYGENETASAGAGRAGTSGCDGTDPS